MLCCLIGGVLVAALARSARRAQGRPYSPLLGLLFGFAGGMLVVGLTISVLVPLGVVDVTGSLPPRVGLLVAPAVVALAASRAGGAGALLTRSGTMAVMVAAIGGALVAEELDLHLWALHSAPGVLAGLAVHSQSFFFLIAGFRWRARLPEERPLGEPCACEPATRQLSES